MKNLTKAQNEERESFVRCLKEKGDAINDWTFGCVAVDDEQIKDVAPMVAPGTSVVIED